MTKKEQFLLESFIEEFKDKEEKRKELRLRIVKSLDKIESELYDDPMSTNDGILTRVNNLEEAVKQIGNLVRRTKVRNEVILGIIGAVLMAIMTKLVHHYVGLNLIEL